MPVTTQGCKHSQLHTFQSGRVLAHYGANDSYSLRYAGRAEEPPAMLASMSAEVSAWRVDLFNRATFVLAAVATPTVIWVSFDPLFYDAPWMLAAAWFTVGALVVTACWRSGPYPVRFGLFMSAEILLFGSVLMRTGWTVGAVLSGVVAILCAGLFSSTRSAILMWLLCGAIGFVHTALVQRGIHAIDLATVDPTNPSVALRFTVVFLGFGAIIAVGTSGLVNRLSQTLIESQRRLSELQEEAIARRQAEAERLEARSQVVELQKTEILGKLAAGVAHDFNNGLQVISGWAELLAEADGKSDGGGGSRGGVVEEATDAILQACENSGKIVQRLLTLGRKQVSVARVLDLRSVVLDAEKSIHHLISDSVSVVVDTPESGFVRADLVQLQQVIFNLCINANYAMEGVEGGVLTVATKVSGTTVQLSIEDTGCGITEIDQGRVFEAFYTTRASEGGSGLGLATVKLIIEQFGGSVSLRSKKGQGTTVTVSLPRSKEPAELVESHRRADLDLTDKHVLVVEDDPQIRRLVERSVQLRGAKTSTALPWCCLVVAATGWT